MNEQIRKVRIWAERGIRLYENQIKEDKDSGVEKSEWNEGCLDTLQRTIAFIDSITDEPVADGMEEAARLFAIPHYIKDIDKSHIDEYPYDTGLEAAFIAGAEWQKEQDQPITGNSLEQEWLRYVDRKKKEYRGELPSLGEYGWLQIARHFAKWQKQQMLKDALEGETDCDDDSS